MLGKMCQNPGQKRYKKVVPISLIIVHYFKRAYIRIEGTKFKCDSIFRQLKEHSFRLVESGRNAIFSVLFLLREGVSDMQSS